MNIYISGRQFGKTTMLIKESAKTGATIAVATYHMAKYVQDMAIRMGLKIPEPVTYAEMFRTYREGKTKRYLVDELQMMLHQLNVDTATVDVEPIRYLNHWCYSDGYSPKVTMLDEMIEKGENNNLWHPCFYSDMKLHHDGSWEDGKWYEWMDTHGNVECARMKLDAYDHFNPSTLVIKKEDVVAFRERRK